MNNKLIVSCALCFGALSAWAEEKTIHELHYAGPYEVHMPFMAESENVNSKAFTEKELLNSGISLNILRNSTQKLINGELPQSSTHALHLVGFSVNNTHYAKARLKIKGIQHYVVYIDGKENKDEEITLLPATHEFVIKCLTEPNKNENISVSLESEQENVFTINNEGKRLYTLKDVLNGTRFSGIELSSNGKYLITKYVTTFDDSANEHITRVTDLTNGNIVAERKEEIHWMPKSNRYYYVRKNVYGKDLITVDPKNGHEQTLAYNIPDGSFQIAPSENYLLYTLSDEGPKEEKDIYRILEPDDRQPGWRNRSYLAKYNLANGMMQRLTYGYNNIYCNSISEDGKSIIFTSNRQRITERPFLLSSVYKMDTETMSIDTLLTNEGFISNCILSPDSKNMLVMGSGEAFNNIGLNIGSQKIASQFDNQLYMFDMTTRKIEPLTKDFNPSVLNVEWNKADGNVYFTANNKDYISLYCMKVPSGEITQIPTSEDVIEQFTLSATSLSLAYYGESVSNADRLYLLNLKNNKSLLHEDLSSNILKDIELGECKDWNYVNSRGDTIYGRYYLPPHFDANKKYPLIVNYYGGCVPTERTFESRYPHNAYAALGYVVYVIQPSGATGFGQEFSARHVNSWGDYTADDIIEGTKNFCKEHQFVNKDKIGCIGASYGGFMTQYLQTKTDIFAAAISHAGISNITSYWGEGYWGYSYSEAASADSYPWNNAALYTEHSPLFHADKIHTPILFLHGSDDTNVPIGESIQMFTALKMLCRETDFIVVDGQNHQILDYNKRIKWQNTIFAWFAKWLQDDPLWWESLYPKRNI